MNIIEDVTNDFCECFKTKEDCVGSMIFLIAAEMLPECVNPNDERVKQIIIWCKKNSSQNEI